MKKLFIVGLMLATFGLNTKAQDMQPKFGIKAGANLMMGGKFDFLGTDYTSKYVPGFQAGLFLNLPLSSKLSFSPEVLYSQKGAKFEASVVGTNGEIKTKMSYLDVPVLLSFNVTPEVNIVLGPQASFLLSNDTKTYVNGVETASTTNKDDLNSAIAGGVVGLGFNITPKLNLNARYSMDFQAVAKDKINQDKARYSGFALSLGYSF